MGSAAMPPPKKNAKKSTLLKSRIFQHFCKLKWSFLQWREGRIRIKRTKITSIILSDEILNRPHVGPMESTIHGPRDLFIEHLIKAEVHFLVLRCLNL